MKTYNISVYTGAKRINRDPGKGNPLPTRTEPMPEQPEPQPGISPKRKKKSIYEIIMETPHVEISEA